MLQNHETTDGIKTHATKHATLAMAVEVCYEYA